MAAEGTVIINPPTCTMVGMLTRIVLGTSAYTAYARNGLINGLIKFLKIKEIIVESQIHQFWSHLLTGIHHKDTLSHAVHVTGLDMRGTPGRQQQNTGVRILHGSEMLFKAFDALAIQEHTLEILTFQAFLYVSTTEVLSD